MEKGKNRLSLPLNPGQVEQIRLALPAQYQAMLQKSGTGHATALAVEFPGTSQQADPSRQEKYALAAYILSPLPARLPQPFDLEVVQPGAVSAPRPGSDLDAVEERLEALNPANPLNIKSGDYGSAKMSVELSSVSMEGRDVMLNYKLPALDAALGESLEFTSRIAQVRPGTTPLSAMPIATDAGRPALLEIDSDYGWFENAADGGIELIRPSALDPHHSSFDSADPVERGNVVSALEAKGIRFDTAEKFASLGINYSDGQLSFPTLDLGGFSPKPLDPICVSTRDTAYSDKLTSAGAWVAALRKDEPIDPDLHAINTTETVYWFDSPLEAMSYYQCLSDMAESLDLSEEDSSRIKALRQEAANAVYVAPPAGGEVRAMRCFSFMGLAASAKHRTAFPAGPLGNYKRLTASLILEGLEIRRRRSLKLKDGDKATVKNLETGVEKTVSLRGAAPGREARALGVASLSALSAALVPAAKYGTWQNQAMDRPLGSDWSDLRDHDSKIGEYLASGDIRDLPSDLRKITSEIFDKDREYAYLFGEKPVGTAEDLERIEFEREEMSAELDDMVASSPRLSSIRDLQREHSPRMSQTMP